MQILKNFSNLTRHIITSKLSFYLIIRLSLGLLIVIRCIHVVLDYYTFSSYFYFEDLIFISIVSILIILFNIGYKLHVVGLLLHYLLLKFDSYFQCSNMFTVTAGFMCIFFALRTWLENKKQYNKADINTFSAWFLIIVFSVINAQSALQHIKDPFWQNGTALLSIFTTPYLSAGVSSIKFINNNIWLQNIIQILTYLTICIQFLSIILSLTGRVQLLLYFWIVPFLIFIIFWGNTGYLKYSILLMTFIFFKEFKSNIKIGQIKNFFRLPHLNKTIKATMLVSLVYFMISSPVNAFGINKVFWIIREWDTHLFVKKKLSQIGFESFNLYNSYQLESGNKYFVISKKHKNSNYYNSIPFMDKEGFVHNYGKFNLPFVNNNGSDFLYYNFAFNALIGNDSFTYNNSVTPYKFKGNVYQRMIQFDMNYNKHVFGEYIYKVEFYEREQPYINGNVKLGTSFIKTHEKVY